MSWGSYTKEAEVGGSGEWPEVADDLYDARVMDVSDPKTGPDTFNPGKEKTDFYITWELLSGEAEGVTLRQYITLPEGFLGDGYLSEKSNLFKVMDALGFDLNGRFTVDPPTWIDMRARVMVENKPNKDGELRPRITSVKPARRTAAAKQKREPVGAGAKAQGAGLRQRLAGEDEWEGDD